MKVTVSIENLLQPLLSLSASNKKWIADRLYESIEEERQANMADEKEAMASAFRQVKALREGKLKTHPVEDLLDEL